MEHVAGVTTYDNFRLNREDSNYRLSILYYNQNKEKLETHEYYFVKEYEVGYSEFKTAADKFKLLCTKNRNHCKRSL